MVHDGHLRHLRAGCTQRHSRAVWMLATSNVQLRCLRQTTADAESDGCTRVRHGTQPREVSGHADELRPLSLCILVGAGGVCAARTGPCAVRAAPKPVSPHI